MSEIERIRSAAPHPENWKPVKSSLHPSDCASYVLLNLMTSWPTITPRRRQNSKTRYRSVTR